VAVVAPKPVAVPAVYYLDLHRYCRGLLTLLQSAVVARLLQAAQDLHRMVEIVLHLG
jgi:hypothetical protein